MELLDWVASHWPEVDWRDAQIRTGACHDVVLAASGQLARTATGGRHAERVAAEVAILATVARVRLPMRTPIPIGALRGDTDRTGVLLRAAPGVASSERPWDDALAATYRAVLEAFAASPAATLCALSAARTWCGGDRSWLVLLVSELAAPRQTFVHGDFGPHNLLWRDGSPSGPMDFDHACLGAPAIDVAPLIGVYGSAPVATIVDEVTLHRAQLHRASLPLQVAAAAHLCGKEALRDHALANFSSRADAGTLYDPSSGSRRPHDVDHDSFEG